MAQTETQFVRIPLASYERLVSFLGRLTTKPTQQSLFGAAVDFALDNEDSFTAYLASVRPDAEPPHEA